MREHNEKFVYSPNYQVGARDERKAEERDRPNDSLNKRKMK